MPSSVYGTFNVLLFNSADSSVKTVPGATVKLYDATNHVDLGVTLTADSFGNIAAGAVAVAAGTVVRFRVEDDGHGRAGWCAQTTVASAAPAGMDLLLRPSPASHNLYFYAMAQEPYRLPATVIPAFFEVAYWLAPRADGTGGERPSAAKRIGFYNIGEEVTIPLNLYRDQPIYVGAKSYNTWGQPNVQDWSQLTGKAVQYLSNQRADNSPVISQFSAATNTDVTLSVSGYNPDFIRYRLVQATDTAGTSQVETLGVAGTVTAGGTVLVTVTAVGMKNSPKTISVTVAGGDNASAVATKIQTALVADPDVHTFFAVTVSTANVIFTVGFATTNDPTMQVQLALGTATGITPAISTHTTAGVKSPNEEDTVTDLTAGIANPLYYFGHVNGATSAATWKFRIAHSAESPDGPWSPFSNILAVTFASSTGGGGSGGSGDPTPPDHQPSFYLPL